MGRSRDRRRGTEGGYLHISGVSDMQEFVLRFARVGEGGGRHCQSTFWVFLEEVGRLETIRGIVGVGDILVNRERSLMGRW